MKRWLPWLLLAVVVAWAVYYIVTHAQEFRVLEHIAPLPALGLFAAAGLYLHAQGLVLRETMKHWQLTLRFREWFGIVAITMLGNYLVPLAGVGYRAVYLHRVHRLPYRHFVASSAAILLLEFLIFAVGGLLGVPRFAGELSTVELVTVLLLGGVLLGVFVVLFFPPIRLRSQNRIVRRAGALLDDWYAIRRNGRLLACVAWPTLYAFVVNAMMFAFAYQALSIAAPWRASLLTASLSDFSLFFRFAPGAAGTYDAAIVYASSVHALDVSEAVLVVLLVRAAMVVWVFTLGPLFGMVLGRRAAIDLFPTRQTTRCDP